MSSYKAKQKTPGKVINKGKVNSQSAKQKKGKSDGASSGGFYYSFLTVILLLCLVQITVSAVLNVSKIVSYHKKIDQITNTRDAAQALNDQLHHDIKNFSNAAGVEAIARNNLKRSSYDEIMVIINEPKEDTTKEKQKKFGIF